MLHKEKLTEKEEREIEYFNQLAREHHYAWWGSKTPAAKIRIERRIDLINKFLKLKAGDKILECGCASGDFTEYLAGSINSNVSLTAIDISPAQIQIARNKVNNKNINFAIESITKMSFRDNTFDYIVGNSILHHLDLTVALKEMIRILKPGGKIIFFEPNMLNPHVWLALNIKPFRKFYQASPDETAFFHWRLKKQLKLLGFKDVFVKPFDFMHPLVPKVFISLVKEIESFLEKTIINNIAGSILIYAEK